MSNSRLYPVRGDDPRLTGSQSLAFNPFDYGNKGDAVNNFIKSSGSGSVAYNDAGGSVIGRGSFEFTGTGVWVVNTLFPVSVDAGIKGTCHYKISSGSGTISVGYESFDSSQTPIAIVPKQNNFLLNAQVFSNTSYLQVTNTVRSEGGSSSQVPVGTRFVRPRIEITSNPSTISVDAFILTHFLDDVLPSGIVHSFAGSSAPQGYFLCDGSTVSRTTYAKLFAAIGTSSGIGDGSTTFNLPDYRGRFLRGVDGVAGNDPDKLSRTAVNGGNSGNAVGSVQADQFASHSHTVGVYVISNLNGPFPNGQNNGSLFSNFGTSGAGGNETRPKNAYVQYIIKY